MFAIFTLNVSLPVVRRDCVKGKGGVTKFPRGGKIAEGKRGVAQIAEGQCMHANRSVSLLHSGLDKGW